VASEVRWRLVDSLVLTMCIVGFVCWLSPVDQKLSIFMGVIFCPFVIALWSVLCTIDDIRRGNFLP
jgi:hypothetical protein